jgi:hypothetical protein
VFKDAQNADVEQKWFIGGGIEYAGQTIDTKLSEGSDIFKMTDAATSDEMRYLWSAAGEFQARVHDDSVPTQRDLYKVTPSKQQINMQATLSFPNLAGTPTFSGHDHSEGGLTVVGAPGIDLGRGLENDGNGSVRVNEDTDFTFTSRVDYTSGLVSGAQIRVPDGSSNNPSVCLNNITSTGWYRGPNNGFAITEGGTDVAEMTDTQIFFHQLLDMRGNNITDIRRSYFRDSASNNRLTLWISNNDDVVLRNSVSANSPQLIVSNGDEVKIDNADLRLVNNRIKGVNRMAFSDRAGSGRNWLLIEDGNSGNLEWYSQGGGGEKADLNSSGDMRLTGTLTENTTI